MSVIELRLATDRAFLALHLHTTGKRLKRTSGILVPEQNICLQMILLLSNT